MARSRDVEITMHNVHRHQMLCFVVNLNEERALCGVAYFAVDMFHIPSSNERPTAFFVVPQGPEEETFHHVQPVPANHGIERKQANADKEETMTHGNDNTIVYHPMEFGVA
ncbi:unnamed protein product [Echinostoma caproni]|uniref:YTH domain-containing protein n=1 Tax=Echinostoma caproni TaxID=27848 RepID=A0A183ANY4_9TREM|nr:unnamed protein product [Echinostoma caproni]